MPPRYAPKLDPEAVARLRAGRIPKAWRASGLCRHCGPVLLPGEHTDFGYRERCPWCPVRERGGHLPTPRLVARLLAEAGTRLAHYLWRYQNAPTSAEDAATIGAPAPPPEALSLDEVDHHPHDRAWIEHVLERVPVDERGGLRYRYGELYRRRFTAEPDPIRREGVARYAANSWLRETVEKRPGGGQHGR